jgi:peptidoglycan/xylan/chitin deacetylase (PgdA/CDA1 family)
VSTLVSVDLDDIACYTAIHGLPAPDQAHAGLVLERALPRFLELFAELDVRATFFVIGRDLERDLEGSGRGAAWLQAAMKAGHELASHSYAHDYGMIGWSADRIAADLAKADALLRGIGAEPRGFRAPGYLHDTRMLRQVAALGYHYDSSLLPSPPYFAVKQSVLAAMRVTGRTSHSQMGHARSFLGPTTPHLLVDSGLWEFPMSVSPTLRWPLIGTTLLAGPEPARRLAYAQASTLAWLHLELHGIDLLDADEDDLAALARREVALRTPMAMRRSRLQALLRTRGGGQSIRSALG